MLLIVIMLILAHTMITTVVDPSKAMLKDTARVSQARLSAEKLANSVKEVSAALGDARKTIHITLPSNTGIVCVSQNLEVEVRELSDGTNKTKSFNTGTTLTCPPISSSDNTSDNSKTYAATIKSIDSSGVSISFTPI